MSKGPFAAMLVNPREVFAVLAIVLVLIAAKRIEIFAFLPLSAIAAIVCFAFAIYLSLRLFAAELEAMRRE